jgi:hypothetical protein
MDNDSEQVDVETHLNDTVKKLQGALNDTQCFLLNIINLEEIPMDQWEQGFESVTGLVDIAKELQKTVKSFKPKASKK